MFFKLKIHETSDEKFYISRSTKLDTKNRAYADFITTIFESTSIKSKCGNAAESISFTLGFPKSLKDKIKRKCHLSTVPEAYAVTVNKAIKIYAASELGFIYAMQTLSSLQESGELCHGFIYDYPLMQTRGYRVFLPSRAGFDDFKRMVDLLSYYKYNSIMLEIGGAMEYKRHPEINTRWAEFCKEVHIYSGRTIEIQRKTYPWKKNSIHADNAEGDILTQDECLELAEYCRSRGLEVIPECPTLSHCDYLVMAHPEIREREGDEYPDSYCPNHKDTYPLVFDMLDEVIKVFRPKTINIGHDEMYSIGVCPRCRRTAAPVLYANDIKVLKEFLDSHGVKTMMWGEKLLNAHKGREAIGGAGHGKGYARVPALYPCRDLIPADVEILHWYYAFNHEYDKVYHERGFKTVYGNLDAMNVEHWNMRREWGMRGGYVSNWGSFGEEYMQRNHQYFALISTAYAFWCDDFEEMGHEARLAMIFEECYRLKLAKIKNPIKITHTTQHNIKFKWFYDGEFIVDDEYLLGNYEIRYTDGKVATLPVKYGTNIGKYSYDDYLHESAFRELSYATMPIRYKAGFAYECVYEDPNPDGKIVGISYIAAAGKEDIEVEMISFAKSTNVIKGATDTGITLSATAEFAWDGDAVK